MKELFGRVFGPYLAAALISFPMSALPRNLSMSVAGSGINASPNVSSAVPWSQIGAKAGADYKGDGLAVAQTPSGARLHCVFQRLDGEAASQGLWLNSTVTNTMIDRFRLTATELGRKPPNVGFDTQNSGLDVPLAAEGVVSVQGQTVLFRRPDLTEEYSVSMDGVRQDFIVEQAPPDPLAGELVVKLAVTGANVQPAAYGACLALDRSGRKVAYSRLRVTDATGKELPARFEVCSAAGGARAVGTRAQLAVVVNDSKSVYPVRIDPTFSDANWVSMGGIPGANNEVLAEAVDGLGNLYIGGLFTVVGNATANYVAEWNGSNWSALGSGIGGGPYPYVRALAVSGSTLYVGGYFTAAGGSAANNIAQWNGTAWSPLGLGIGGGKDSGGVLVLAVSDTALYVGGSFTTAGGIAANRVAKWNGTNWSALGLGMTSGQQSSTNVTALAVSGNTLYAGGDFTTAGGNPATNIAQWNGTGWSALGSGIPGGQYAYVSALAVMGDTVYAQGVNRIAIAQWNGTDWSTVPSVPFTGVNALMVSGNTLYATGYSVNQFGYELNSVAAGQLNGGIWSWTTLSLPMNGPATALAVSGTTLYASGQFTYAGNSAADSVAQWNGTNWSPLGAGIGGTFEAGFRPYVDALAVAGSTVYAGGYFTMPGGDTNANNIAQWNGIGWSAVGLGLDGSVSALVVSGSTLYVGGDFTMAGGDTNANYIAQWNGGSWSAVGLGMDNDVYALAVSGATLFAGGDFTTAGEDTNANCVAQWNGGSWSGLGSGIGGAGNGAGPYVSTLAASGGTLYVGGDFTTAGTETNANYIAEWTGTNWSDLGSGMDGIVSALAVSDGILYAGGEFATAGDDTNANCIAQWNGSSWSGLGLGIGSPYTGSDVLALAVSGATLYAGGIFTNAGGIPANNIAQWNGSGWSTLGSGLNGEVDGLAQSSGTLYVGGSFTTAGTNVSAYAAEAIVGAAPPNYTISVNASPTSDGGASGSGTFPGGSTQTVSAEANAGYAFVDWTVNGTVVSSLANYTFTLNSNVALVANFTTLQTNAFCTEIQTANSSSISYDSGLFTYTDSDASDTSEEHAILPLCGAAASAVSSANGWTASISVNLSARTFTAATSHAELGLVVSTNLSGPLSSAGFVFELVQENNTGDGDGGSTDIYPDGWYGTAISFQALVNGARDPATSLGGSQATGNGSIYLLLSGGTTSSASSEPIDSASGILTITYDPSNETVIGTYNGTNVASYSLGRWGPNPPLALGVWGGSGKLLAVSSGTATASNFYASAITSSGPAPLSLVTNSGAFGFTNGVFGFSISGPAGSNVVIQASTNLQNWIPLQTNLLGSGLSHFSDAFTNRQRFYRAVLP